MRKNVRALVELAAKNLALRGPVYEFGAYQVDGQPSWTDLRDCFPGETYIGCDMRPGPGVDRVEDVTRLTLDDACAQCVLCVDTLEHVFDVHQAVAEMLRVLRPGGTLLLTAPLQFHIHCHPDDYWRLTPNCLLRLLGHLPLVVVGSQGTESFPHTVFALAVKGPVPAGAVARLSRLMNEFQLWLAQQARLRPWRERLKHWLLGPLRSKGERRRWREQDVARFYLHAAAEAAPQAAGLAELTQLPARRPSAL